MEAFVEEKDKSQPDAKFLILDSESYQTCNFCNGSGSVTDPTISGCLGLKTCPYCKGAKILLKKPKDWC